MTNADREYQWIELAAHKNGRMLRNHFVRVDDSKAVEDWRYTHGNRDLYASICRFREPKRSNDYVCDLILDIDAEGELRAAKRQAEGVCEALVCKWGVEPGWIGVWFSGAKGFHISVPHQVFGGPIGGHVLPIYRKFAMRLKKREGFIHIDGGIYDPSRILRLPNSVHTKTSLYKLPLEYAELIDLELEYICEMAREQRGEDTMAVPAGEAPLAMQWWLKAVDWYEQYGRQRRSTMRAVTSSGWRYPPCVRKAERATLEDGDRHNVLFALARFYALINMAPGEIAYRLEEINSRNPIRDQNYIERSATDARKYKGFDGCSNDALARFCEPEQCFLRQSGALPGQANGGSSCGGR